MNRELFDFEKLKNGSNSNMCRIDEVNQQTSRSDVFVIVEFFAFIRKQLVVKSSLCFPTDAYLAGWMTSI